MQGAECQKGRGMPIVRSGGVSWFHGRNHARQCTRVIGRSICRSRGITGGREMTQHLRDSSERVPSAFCRLIHPALFVEVYLAHI